MRIAFDPLLMTHNEYQQLAATACEFIPLDASPFDTLWADRPAAPAGLLRAMPVAVSGESSADKRRRVAQLLHDNGADYLALTMPDNIAWLLSVPLP